MCVLISWKTFVETFLILRITERDMINKCRLVLMKYTRFSCAILIKLEFSHQILEKYSNIRFHENPSSGCRVVPCVQTDGQREEGTDRRRTDGQT
jgi:hypothetical protein